MADFFQIKVSLNDRSEQFMALLEGRMPAIREAIGMKMQEHAVKNIKNAGQIDTGTARNSINYAINGNKIYVGSNLEYFPYLELGTGIHASNGKGRKGWWVYVLNSDKRYKRKGEKRIYTKEEATVIMAMLRAKGLDAHITNGIKPSHSLRDAVANHMDEYKEIVREGLKNI